jgi:putative glutathione S-transferase
VSSTVNLAHIKAGYYSVKALNPQGIVPLGPENIFVNQKSVSEGHNYDA